jgi:hypothetical protein
MFWNRICMHHRSGWVWQRFVIGELWALAGLLIALAFAGSRPVCHRSRAKKSAEKRSMLLV